MSPSPLYERIRDDLLAQIRSGTLPLHERLPSEAALAEQYGVTRMTVRQALGELAAQGFVTKRRGLGTFVADARPAYRNQSQLGSFKDEVGIDDALITTLTKDRRALVPGVEVATELGLKKGQQAIRLLRLRLIDGKPAALQESWLSYALAPALVREELVDGSLYRTLRERHGIAVRSAEQRITAVAASEELGGWLAVEVGAPLIHSTRWTRGDGSLLVEYARSWTRPELPLLVRLEPAES
jgi:GntR family transcriptional regulator